MRRRFASSPGGRDVFAKVISQMCGAVMAAPSGSREWTLSGATPAALLTIPLIIVALKSPRPINSTLNVRSTAPSSYPARSSVAMKLLVANSVITLRAMLSQTFVQRSRTPGLVNRSTTSYDLP